MITITLAAAELTLLLVWVAVRAVCRLRQGRIDGKREALLLLMLVNLAVLLRFTFFPMARVAGRVQPLLFDPEAIFPLRVNLIPFVHLLNFDTRRDLLLNLIGNFAMFIPSGIIMPILWPKLRGFWRTVAAGALLSLAIELLQLPFASRASDVDDLILNSLGAAAGYAILALCRRTKKDRPPNDGGAKQKRGKA